MIWGGGRFSSSPGIPLLAALASPFALRRGVSGVLCFSLVPACAGMT